MAKYVNFVMRPRNGEGVMFNDCDDQWQAETYVHNRTYMAHPFDFSTDIFLSTLNNDFGPM